jgi:hypothetical protein
LKRLDDLGLISFHGIDEFDKIYIYFLSFKPKRYYGYKIIMKIRTLKLPDVPTELLNN